MWIVSRLLASVRPVHVRPRELSVGKRGLKMKIYVLMRNLKPVKAYVSEADARSAANAASVKAPPCHVVAVELDWNWAKSPSPEPDVFKVLPGGLPVSRQPQTEQ